MDITAKNFFPELHNVLIAMTNANFIAIDLELSGVPETVSDTRGGGAMEKIPLQQRYELLKHAASKYSVLQLGLTVAHELSQSGRSHLSSVQVLILRHAEVEATDGYSLRTYNLNLRPTIHEDLRLDRDIIFSSKGTQDIAQPRTPLTSQKQ